MQPRKQQHQPVASISQTAIAATTASKTISLDTKPTSEDSPNPKAAEMVKVAGKRGRKGRLGRRMPRRKSEGEKVAKEKAKDKPKTRTRYTRAHLLGRRANSSFYSAERSANRPERYRLNSARKTQHCSHPNPNPKLPLNEPPPTKKKVVLLSSDGAGDSDERIRRRKGPRTD
jgi:hypothetical protein